MLLGWNENFRVWSWCTVTVQWVSLNFLNHNEERKGKRRKREEKKETSQEGVRSGRRKEGERMKEQKCPRREQATLQMKGFQDKSTSPWRLRAIHHKTVAISMQRQGCLVLSLAWALGSPEEIWTHLYSIKSVFGCQTQWPGFFF